MRLEIQKTLIILGTLLVALSLILGACESGESAKAPEDMIPLTVTDFNFVEKSDRVEPLFEGEEYSAVSFFTPKTNSKFQGEVDHLTVWVLLFEDETSGTDMTSIFLVDVSVAEIQIGEREATLTYNEDNGETIVFYQQGKLVIYSLSAPPFESTIFDEEALEEAAIEGFKAVRF
jgi:hypothetical protein